MIEAVGRLIGIIIPFVLIYPIKFLENTYIGKKSKLKIIRETKSNGSKEFIIYKNNILFYRKTYESFDNYNDAFDFVVKHEDKRR
jgi:hypothetical protein